MARPPQAASTKELGGAAEDQATDYLRCQGFRILARNYRAPGGEIDVVAKDGRTLCFVEVRSRSRNRLGSAAESIDRPKQLRIARAARSYLHQHKHRGSCRFDVVTLDGGKIALLKDAFRLGDS